MRVCLLWPPSGGHHQLVQVCRCREAVVIVQASLEGDTQTQVGRDEVFVGAVGVGDLGTDVGDLRPQRKFSGHTRHQNLWCTTCSSHGEGNATAWFQNH